MIAVVFSQVGSVTVDDTTYLRAPFMTPVIGSVGSASGQYDANSSYVRAADQRGVAVAHQLADDGPHLVVEVGEVPRSGDSTTPSSEMNSPDLMNPMMCSSIGRAGCPRVAVTPSAERACPVSTPAVKLFGISFPAVAVVSAAGRVAGSDH